MRSYLTMLAVAWMIGLSCGHAEVTPMNQPLQDDKEITIACEFNRAVSASDAPTISGSQPAQGTYHYKLYIPKGYSADTKRRYPCMFIASPGGGASMGNMGKWLKANGYVAVCLVESRNGPWAPIIANFLAAHDDVVQRVRIQEGLKMSTGMSGGARAASVFAQIRPGFSGLIMQAAGAAANAQGKYHVAGLKKDQPIYVAMTVGDSDGNKVEVDRLRPLFSPAMFRVYEFKGGHTWAPADVFEQAMTWIERVYLQRAQSQLSEVQSTTEPWPRYKKINELTRFAGKRGLANDPVLSKELGKLQAELASLRQNPAITKEVMAMEALQRLEQSRDRTPPAMFTASCRNLAKQYAGTEAAARAQSLADGQ
jgi:hypothetical protein